MGFIHLFNTHRFWSSIRTLLTRQLFTKLMSLIIIVSMLATTTPAAPSVILASASEFGQDVRYSVLTSPTLASLAEIDVTNNFVFAFFFGGRNQQRIALIEISPNTAMIRDGEKIALTAVAYDSRNNPIQGVKFNWSVSEINQQKSLQTVPQALPDGVFEPEYDGLFSIVAEAGGVNSSTQIFVQKETKLRALKENAEIDKAARLGKQLNKQYSPEVGDEMAKPRPAPFSNSTKMTQEQADQLNKSQQSKNEINQETKDSSTKSEEVESRIDATRYLVNPDENGGLNPSAEKGKKTVPFTPSGYYSQVDSTSKQAKGQVTYQSGSSASGGFMSL